MKEKTNEEKNLVGLVLILILFGLIFLRKDYIHTKRTDYIRKYNKELHIVFGDFRYVNI